MKKMYELTGRSDAMRCDVMRCDGCSGGHRAEQDDIDKVDERRGKR